jgi:hypothetical protein
MVSETYSELGCILIYVIEKKKSMQKIKTINVKWTPQDKIYNNHVI